MDFNSELESELAKRVSQERSQPASLEDTNRYELPRPLLRFVQKNVSHSYIEPVPFEGGEFEALCYNGDFYIPR